MKRIFAVVLHYKGKQFTCQCLLSLQKIKIGDFSLEVIVVDNYSPEPIDEFRKEFKKVIFLKSSQNLGFAGGNNLGIKYALKNGADGVLVLNNDTILDKNLLVQLIKVASLNDGGAIFGPKIYFAPGYEYHKERYKPEDLGKVIWYAGGMIDWQNILASHRGVDEIDKGQYDVAGGTDFVSGCALFTSRKVFERIGLFDERYFLYLEDLDFCQRAREAGFKIIYAPQAKLWHKNAGSSVVGGSLHDYFLTRNRLLFGLKYGQLRTKLALLRESFKLLFSGRSWQKIGVRDFYSRKFGQGSWK